MALVLLYVVIICWKLDEFAYATAMIFLLLGGLNFLSITGTYIALTILLYTAVVHPFFYQSNITIKHCYIFIALIWVCSTMASVRRIHIGYFSLLLPSQKHSWQRHQ
ncbi:hypothetical protein COOONC_19473 [Cooperia oncophora]